MACLNDVTIVLVVQEPVEYGVTKLLKGLRVDGGRQEVVLLQARILHRRIQLVLRCCHSPACLQILARPQQRHLVAAVHASSAIYMLFISWPEGSGDEGLPRLVEANELTQRYSHVVLQHIIP